VAQTAELQERKSQNPRLHGGIASLKWQSKTGVCRDIMHQKSVRHRPQRLFKLDSNDRFIDDHAILSLIFSKVCAFAGPDQITSLDLRHQPIECAID
jgi:hypothetical protein